LIFIHFYLFYVVVDVLLWQYCYMWCRYKNYNTHMWYNCIQSTQKSPV